MSDDLTMRQDDRVTSVTFTLPAGHKWTSVEAAMKEAHDREYELRMAFFWECQRLKAEVERLRASSFVTAVPVEQYERLRNAGDAMLLALWLGVDEYSKEQKEKAEEEWNAANREQGCLVNPIKVAQYLPKPPTREGEQS